MQQMLIKFEVKGSKTTSKKENSNNAHQNLKYLKAQKTCVNKFFPILVVLPKF